MGRRTLRYRTERLTAEALRPHLGQPVDVLGHDGVTRHGVLVAVETEHLEIEDSNRAWYNWRRHRHRLSLDQVAEVYAAPWQGY